MKFTITIISFSSLFFYAAFSSNVMARSASEQLQTLQSIVNETKEPSKVQQKLREVSELGRLLSDYLIFVDELTSKNDFVFPDTVPENTIPNYVFLRALSKHRSKLANENEEDLYKRVIRLNSEFKLIEKTSYFYNFWNYKVNVKNSADIYSQNRLIKNLRYMSQYNANATEVYFRQLKKTKRWVVTQELDYWNEALNAQHCIKGMPLNQCIDKLSKLIPKREISEADIIPIICDVRLRWFDEVINIKVCD